ncbi:MAG: PVC-type heme-binding CxxCH protein [Mariniblastus sp.]
MAKLSTKQNTQSILFTFAIFVCATIAGLVAPLQSSGQDVSLRPGDSVCYIGNTTADRMQHHGWLETYIHAALPMHDLTFRNLGFAADEINLRPRSDNFGSPDQWLTKCKADVVFCFFGYNEALKGKPGLEAFEKNLVTTIDGMLAQKYNGKSAPRLVFFSPIAHENLKSPHLPDGAENNANLELYSATMKRVCESKKIPYVDLFYRTGKLYQTASEPLTMNGIHLLDRGNKEVAQSVFKTMFRGRPLPADERIAKLREAVLEKNYYWFSRYRVVDGYNVFGGRSKLAWFNQSNADVMMREMEMFDVLTANRDKRVWALAKGNDVEVNDDNLPDELVVKPNKVGPLDGGAWPYLGAEEAIDKMHIHKNMKVNVFASEEMFPRLINPVQMAVDTNSRLWVATWESYPHWNPKRKRNDCIMILPDEDEDGVADEAKIFADGLNSVTGFEFWGGGVLVAAPPEIWYLKDTDGDDKADLKIRMLQGISSADSHHSANALLIGPDGWLYFSRGIFNVANFETPTKTFRSGQSGVHRFNPRTFEFEFHFPIGPNPHGDSFDAWGYQFANDGTSGTGSYINIGKGVGNKQWFEKHYRPVPANGFLSSSHFPEENFNNFLIGNTIGFLGVAQQKVSYNGADITSTEIEPIVFSDDPNFRPSDMEIGGDGGLYISDWHNTLIGHMQHNMRDPNRDRTHGRIYRVTYEGRDLLKPAKMKGKPISEVCENFFARENGTRYRARLELSGRKPDEIVAQVGAFAKTLDPAKDDVNRNEAQALLECLWAFEEQRIPNMPLLTKVFEAKEPRVRAAAIRTLGHWAGKVPNWETVLATAANDSSALVRAEAVKSAVDLGGLSAAEAVFAAGALPTDPEMETVLKYAKRELQIGTLVQKLLDSGKPLSQGAADYVLATGSVSDLLKLPASPVVAKAILSRKSATPEEMSNALTSYVADSNVNKTKALVQLITEEQENKAGNIVGLGELLATQPIEDLKSLQSEVENLAVNGATPDVKRLGYAAWVAAAGPGDAFLAATKSKTRLRDFLDAVPVVNAEARGSLFDKVKPLIFEMPASLESEKKADRQNGVTVGYSAPHGADVRNETVDARAPSNWTVVEKFEITIPEGRSRDQFINLFKASIEIPKTGDYVFYTASDDGSRLYIDGESVVDNDGDHGVIEKSGKITLTAGMHSIRVNYNDSGGGDSLTVSWQGPGIEKQEIPGSQLFVLAEDTLHEVAIRALASIPGREKEKFEALCSLVSAGKNQASAITALKQISSDDWKKEEVKPLMNNIIGYLSALPAKYRTSPSALEAMELARSLGASLGDDEMKALENRLGNLNVRVIAIGTVPHRMIYDKEMIVVESGKPVEFRFSNTDSMPHNFAITIPGALEEVGELGEATGRDADAMVRHYIPKSDKVLVGSKLLQPGEEEAISFDVKLEPGVYPYVCTYPGHWRRMYGALYVVPSFEEYQGAPEQYLADLKLPVKDELLKLNTRGQAWTYDDLIADVKMPMKRSHEVGQASFKAANCVACHKFNGEGQDFGPDLAALTADKIKTDHILRSIIEPSKDIDEKYQSTKFFMASGKIITGLVTGENDKEVRIVIDPLAKNQETIILKDDIDDRSKSKLSQMPAGMVDKLSREEIIDLVAYIISKGDPNHKVFEGGHAHDAGMKMEKK